MEKLLIPLVLAVTNRIRGGWFGDKIRKVIPFYGSQLGRTVHGLGVGISVLLLGGSLTFAGLAVAATVLGYILGPFGPRQGMERRNDILILGLRGVILHGPLALVLATFVNFDAAIVMLTLGMFMGVVYAFARQLPIIKFINDVPETRDQNDTAEVIFGMLQGIVLVGVI